MNNVVPWTLYANDAGLQVEKRTDTQSICHYCRYHGKEQKLNRRTQLQTQETGQCGAEIKCYPEHSDATAWLIDCYVCVVPEERRPLHAHRQTSQIEQD